MKQVNMHEAKTQLSHLGKLAWQGEEIIIAKSGTPFLRLIPYESPPRKPGSLKGQIKIEPDFDETPREVVNAFYESA